MKKAVKENSRQVPGAKEGYGIDKQGTITNPKGQEVSVHANAEGHWGTVRLYTPDGKQKSFRTEDLFNAAWPELAKKRPTSGGEAFVKDRAARGAKITMPATTVGKGDKPARKEKEADAPVVATDEEKKIKKLDTSYSIKAWKLHQLGRDVKQIMAILERPDKPTSTKNAIESYKTNKSLRDKADAVEVK